MFSIHLIPETYEFHQFNPMQSIISSGKYAPFLKNSDVRACQLTVSALSSVSQTSELLDDRTNLVPLCSDATNYDDTTHIFW